MTITNLNIKFKKDIEMLPIATQMEIRHELYYNTQEAYRELPPMPIKRKHPTIHNLMKQFIADSSYPDKRIQGVYYDKENNKTVATNGKILAIYDSCDSPQTCIVDRKGNYIKEQYVPYWNAIPQNYTQAHILTIEDILGKVKAICTINEVLMPNRPYEGINVKGVYISEKYLNKALQAFYDLGESEVVISMTDKSIPVRIRGNKSLLTVILTQMRTRAEDCIYSI